MILGHSISTSAGVIQTIDESVATVLQRTQKELVGMSYMSITHPGDIARNLAQIAALQPNGNSSRIRKRYIGGDGAIITLEVQVSRIGKGTGGHLFGTLSTVPPAVPPPLASPLTAAGPSVITLDASDLTPYRLWHRARNLLEVTRSRDAILGAELFADYAWTSLLIVYVAEAESRIATVESIGTLLKLPRTTLIRWIRVLQSKSLVEHDVDLDAVQLTQTGILRIERLLAAKAPVTVG
ncbi:MAG: hypothetical protein EOP66_08515 [Sphingomonas sp.]|nr:MAG: hypothetical protein EOP66_08515 [Sphingomonas sp.]